MITTLKYLFASFRFFRKTGHFPKTYRDLFKQISNCYFTPQAPGKALLKNGERIVCTTSGARMFLEASHGKYWIDCGKLFVQTPFIDDELPLEHPSFEKLRRTLDVVLKNRFPFRMSETNVTNLGI